MDADPIKQFASWYRDAEASVKSMPEAVCLCTADPSGRPSARMVLMKGFDADGFVFFTNYESRKAMEMITNPQAFLLFYWKELGRQVRIEGPVERVSSEESDDYFATRPRQSQLGAWASAQSRPIKSRFTLLRKVASVAARFANKPVERPPHWGGFRLHPDRMEFWHDRPFRLHDRFEYRMDQGVWKMERLSP
ncbi:MAG: pyridoxamine 5'-phosphate oxidase [Flavobacteriales bacterium]|nr:pyridoxamine 5'-phosphate oxidase [Flavobacteriales bacterium]